MKRKLLSILVLFLFCISFSTSYAKKNKILFKIDEKIITSIDLLNETRYLMSINKELKNIEKKKIYELAKKTLIRNKIKEVEIFRNLGEHNIDNKVIINVLLKQYNTNSEKELDNYFDSNKINKNFVMNKIKNEILWNEIILVKFLNKVKINKEQILNDIKNNSKEKQFLLSEILFNLEENEILEKKLNLINQDIKNKSFSEAALFFSISSSSEKGGKIGWVGSSSLNKKILDELYLIKKGEITKPIVIPGGFLILKIDDIREKRIDINIKDAYEKISKEKTQEQLEQFSSIYFNKVKKNLIINEL